MSQLVVNRPVSFIYRPDRKVFQKLPPPIDKSQLVKQVALATLKEATTTLIFTTVSCFFAATPLTVGFFIGSAAFLLTVNLILRCMHAHSLYELATAKASNECQRMKTIAPLVCGYNFAVFDSMTRDILVHEAGHALAFKALWKNVHPEIILRIGGGATSANYQGLTNAGKFFGERVSGMIIAGAGTGFAFTVALINIIIAHKIYKNHPNLSWTLNFMAVMSIFNHVLYALSAVFPGPKMSGHDFVALARAGLHPLAAVTLMVAIPILLKGALYLSDRRVFSH